MTRIAFVADLHADDLGHRNNPETGLSARFEDAIGILRWVARDAAQRDCEVLIVGGDFTEQRHPAPWRVALIADALRDFAETHQERPHYVLLRGNHDGLRAGASIANVLAQMLPRATGFSRPGVALLPGRLAVCAVPYLDRAWLRASQPELASAPDADIYRILGEQFVTIARGQFAQARALGGKSGPGSDKVILVVHQGLAGGQMTDAQAAFLGDLSLVVDTAALAAVGFDAVLAGHFHMHQVLREDPLVVYAGSPHRVTFQEEAQQKGYLVIDTDELPAFEFVETPARRFVTLRWDPDAVPEPELQFLPMAPGIKDAVVRALDVPAGVDTASVRRHLDALGAFEVTEVRVARAEAVPPSGLGEATAPADALVDYFAGDVDAEALVERGHGVLAEVSA